MKVILKEKNVEKFLQDKPYLEYSKAKQEIDFCLGQSKKEAGNICRKIVEKTSKQ